MLKTVSSVANAIGALNYKGIWNASTNTPALASGVGTQGDYYVVSVAGATDLDGITNWGVGDWVTFNGSVWQRVEGGADGNFVNLDVSGTANTSLINVDRNDALKAIVLKKSGVEIGSLRILDTNKVAIAGEGSTLSGLMFNNNGRILPVYNGDRQDDAVDFGQSAGPFRFKNVYLSGNVYLADGKGIDFSATAGTGTSELLDDYEEGTWTPTGNGITLTTAVGRYTKVGNVVNISGYVEFPVGSDGNLALLTGIPYTPANTEGAVGNSTISATNYGAALYGRVAANLARFYLSDASGNLLTNANMSGKNAYFGSTYFV